MQGQTEGDRNRGSQRNIRALDAEPAVPIVVRVDCGLSHAGQIGACPVRIHQKIMGACQCAQPFPKSNPRLWQRNIAAQGLRCDGLHHGQRIFDPVVQLAHQNVAMLFGLPAFCDVARNAGRPQKRAGLVQQRRFCHRHPDRRSIGPNARYFIVQRFAADTKQRKAIG